MGRFVARGWRIGAAMLLTAAALLAVTPNASSASSGKAATAVADPKAAFAAAPDQRQFRLINRAGKCIGIEAAGWAGQWPCTWNRDQVWRWHQYQQNNGQFASLINGNGHCLALNGGSNADNTPLVAYHCTNSHDQYWKWEPTTGGHANLKNYHANERFIGRNSGGDGGKLAVKLGIYAVDWQPQYL